VYLGVFGGNPIFGILSGALVVLVWMYLLSLALLLGAELNAVLAERADEPDHGTDMSRVGIGAVSLHPGPNTNG